MENFIRKNYPEAEEGRSFTSRIINKLTEEHRFDLSKTLLATSVCSDEIIRSATNFREHLVVKEPFQLGGLAGYPFAGLTGLTAFASHIPDDGMAVIQYGPHIGISRSGEAGVMNRSGQFRESSCCGALQAALSHFESENPVEPDPELDYQLWKIEQELKPDLDTIFRYENRLVGITESMFQTINKSVRRLLTELNREHGSRTFALIGGIIINTDYDLPDWFDLRHFEVM